MAERYPVKLSELSTKVVRRFGCGTPRFTTQHPTSGPRPTRHHKYGEPAFHHSLV